MPRFTLHFHPMPTSRARPTPSAVASPSAPAATLGPLAQHLIAAIAIFTALMSAGSCGLIGHPLRHALTLAGLLGIAAGAIGRGPGLLRRVAIIALFTGLAVYLSASSLMIVNALSVVVLLGGITMAQPDALPALRPVVFATFIFALYRIAHNSIASAWLAADFVGHMLGKAGGAIGGSST